MTYGDLMEWTYKYQPKTPREYVGIKRNVKIMSNFLESWICNVPSKKCIILHGLPGEGKTSLVYALETTFNLNIIEVNASDKRNSLDVKKLFSISTINALENKLTLILLDEADGINAWETVKELIARSQAPIVMTCNDISKVPYDLIKICSIMQVEYPPTNLVIDHLDMILRSETEFSESEYETLYKPGIEKIAIKCNSVRSAIMTLQSCVTAKNFRKIIPQDVEYSEVDQIKRIFAGEKGHYDVSPATICRWAIVNNVALHGLDKLVKMGREYPNMSEIVKAHSLTIRCSKKRLLSPYYMLRKSNYKPKIPKTKFKDKEDKPIKEKKIKKVTVLKTNVLGDDDIW